MFVTKKYPSGNIYIFKTQSEPDGITNTRCYIDAIVKINKPRHLMHKDEKVYIEKLFFNDFCKKAKTKEEALEYAALLAL